MPEQAKSRPAARLGTGVANPVPHGRGWLNSSGASIKPGLENRGVKSGTQKMKAHIQEGKGKGGKKGK
jgi:hypothetical protein